MDLIAVKSLQNAFLVVLIISGLMLAGNTHFVGAQSSATGTPTPTAPPIPVPSSTTFPGSTPTPQPTSQFPIPPARTNVNGIINSDTTWTKANSPYNLTGPVTVSPGVTLTIEPGTIVDANYLNYLQINGTINARGTTNEPINFNGGQPLSAPNGLDLLFGDFSGGDVIFSQSSSSWNQQTQSGSIIENAVIEDLVINGGSPKISANSLLNIDIFGGSPEISNNNIIGGIGVYGSLATISNNIISQQTHYLWGVFAQRYDRNNAVIFVGNNASATISNNIIDLKISHVGSGIGFGTEGFTGSVLVTVTNNTIYGFQGEGIGIAVFAGTGNVAISGNTVYDCYWGIGVNGTDPIEDGSLAIVTTIQRNFIFNNTVGIDLAYPAAIENNTISNNLMGIVTSVPSTITYNNIEGNNQSIYLASSNNLDATYNWWGSTVVASINQTIYDFKNDFKLGTVDFVPFLNEQNTQAMLLPNLPLTPSPTPTLTSSPSSTPTLTPSVSPSQNSISFYEILIVVLVLLIVAFVTVIIVFIRERRR